MYLAYGLRVRSALPLHGLPGADDATDPDVDVRWQSTRTIPAGLPAGEPLLHAEADGATRYAAAFDGRVYRLRFPGCCEFTIDADLRAVDCAGVDPELASILATGALLSFLLTIGGAMVLHASAVQVGDAAVGIVGASGYGKSTVAALLCAGGCELVTDDVLRVETADDVLVHAGADELRLRPSVRAITECFPHAVTARDTADGRLALRPPRTTHARLPLAALVIPSAARTSDRTGVRRVQRVKALVRLLAFPRLLGWTSNDVLSRQFVGLADLVERVPVLQAHVPSGPPFAPAMGERLRDALLAGIQADPHPLASSPA